METIQGYVQSCNLYLYMDNTNPERSINANIYMAQLIGRNSTPRRDVHFRVISSAGLVLELHLGILCPIVCKLSCMVVVPVLEGKRVRRSS